MKYVLDSHTHTLASGHAYNTIREMTDAAAKKGLELLALTEHCVKMPGSCHEFYFQNYRMLNRNAYALPTLFGVELNILDEHGTIDMSQELLSTMDVAIASIHPPCLAHKMSKQDVTQAVIHVLENPLISIIGHLDDSRLPVDYDEVVRAAAANHKLFEVNNSSLGPGSYRPGAHDNYLTLLECCEKHGVEIILNSDAHVDTAIGCTIYSEPLIAESGFPEEHIVNDSLEHYFSYLRPEIPNYFK